MFCTNVLYQELILSKIPTNKQTIAACSLTFYPPIFVADCSLLSPLCPLPLTPDLWPLTPACPVKFFEENERSEFNRGLLASVLYPLHERPLWLHFIITKDSFGMSSTCHNVSFYIIILTT